MRKTRQNHQKTGLSQKSKVPKWVCRSPLASFCSGQPFFAIFGPARGQIFGKKAEKIVKKMKEKLSFLAFYIGNPGLIQKVRIQNGFVDPPLASFCNGPPFFAIFGPARGQIFGKNAEKTKKANNQWICAFLGPFI